jgi:hypothetical protein
LSERSRAKGDKAGELEATHSEESFRDVEVRQSAFFQKFGKKLIRTLSNAISNEEAKPFIVLLAQLKNTLHHSGLSL